MQKPPEGGFALHAEAAGVMGILLRRQRDEFFVSVAKQGAGAVTIDGLFQSALKQV